MNNSLAINPGYAASRDLVCITGIHRQQWVGLAGAPQTSGFSINAPVKLLKGGVGLNIVNEKIAFDKSLAMSAIYAYMIDINDGQGKLGIGTNFGFINSSLDAKEWIGPDGTSISTDNSVPSQKESDMAFDLGLGLYYRTDNLYFGISATHLTAPEKDNYSKGKPEYKRHFYITSGYTLPLSNPSFEFIPSVFIGSTTDRSAVYDLNAMLLYNKKIWGGISYRLSSAIIGMFGLELKNGLRIGYSYDFCTSQLQGYNSGSHELSLGYSFSMEKEKIPHKYKSVRFL